VSSQSILIHDFRIGIYLMKSIGYFLIKYHYLSNYNLTQPLMLIL